MNNTALITGSYGGLGAYLARVHAKKGGDLVLVGRSQEKYFGIQKRLMNKININNKPA